MKTKLKRRIILFLAGLAALFLLGGCSLGRTLDDILEENNLVAQVTYYSNGGAFKGTPEKKDLYYANGAIPLDIGNKNVSIASGNITLERTNYDFAGWHYGVADEEGNPTFEDEAKTVFKTNGPVDFTKPIQTGDHWLFVAMWSAKVKVNVQLVYDGAEGEKIGLDGSETTYQNGDIVTTYNYDTTNKVVEVTSDPFNVKDNTHTFLEYYADKACTTLVKWPLEKGENQEADATIYAKYIKGDWTVVRNVKDALNMFGNGLADKSYWLLRDIDMSGKQIAPKAQFAYEIQGNNHTISNLKVVKGAINSDVSLFGKVLATAKVENLTISNITIEYSLRQSANAYFVFTSLATGAVFNNVKLSGTMKIAKPDSADVYNMMGGFTNCLYGGFEADTAYQGGITVEGDPATFITIGK